MKLQHFLASTFCCALALTGCGSSDSTTENSTVEAPVTEISNAVENAAEPALETTAMPAASAGKTYSNVRGQIVRVVPRANGGEPMAVEIDHETVPDFMQAMRMTIPLHSADDAKMLKTGDKIRFDLMLGKGLEIVNIEMLPAATKLNLAASAKMDTKP